MSEDTAQLDAASASTDENDFGAGFGDEAKTTTVIAPKEKVEATPKVDGVKPAKTETAGQDGNKEEKVEETIEQRLENKAKLKVEERAQAQAQDNFEVMIKTARADALDVARSPEFRAWVKSQPQHVMDMASQTENVKEALSVIEMFEKSKNPAAAVAESKGLDRTALLGIKFKNGEEEMSVGDFMNTYGEVGEAAITIANAIVDARMKGIQMPQLDTAAIDQLKGEVASLRYWQDVQEAHPDAKKLVASPEFKTWSDTQSKAIQRLLTQGDRQDLIDILDYYKQGLVAAKKGAIDAKNQKKKDSIDRVFSSTLRGGSGSGSEAGSASVDEDDFEGGFKEANQKLKAAV